MQDQATMIPLDQIIEPRMVLRLVNRDSVEYLELRDSVAAHGFWNSVSVRPSKRVPDKFEIIDGLHRYTVARELDLPAMPCIVKHNVSDDDVLSAQIQANAIRPETKPVEFAHQLKRILTRKPEMTFMELSTLVKKTPQWVGRMMGLLTLAKDIQKMVDRGEMLLQNAYMLSKLPPRLQRDYLDKAKLLPMAEFKALVSAVLKNFKEAVHQGKLERHNLPEFAPVAYLRPVKEVLAELETKEVGALLVVSENCKTAVDGWYLALQWAAHLDRDSVEQQRIAAETRTQRNLRRYTEDGNARLEDD